MLVRAIATGYAGKNGHALREPGDTFEIEDEIAAVALKRQGGTWFVPVEPEKKGKKEADSLV